MSDTATQLRVAQLMPGVPRTASGHLMSQAHWYRLTPPTAVLTGPAEYVAVTKIGVYPCDSRGEQVDFTRCIHRYGTGAADAGSLARLDGGYRVAGTR